MKKIALPPPHLFKEHAARIFFLTAATSSVLILGLITLHLFTEGAPLFAHLNPITDFLLNMDWYPTDEADPAFGILPLLTASLAVTLLSAAMAVPLGVMTAVYLSEIAPSRVRGFIKPLVELPAALPSVVLGFFGLVVVAPWLQDTFNIPVGLNLFTASLLLAFMSLPTICSIAEDALYAVPRDLKEASLALGATAWETIIHVSVPGALSGICTAVILGMSRAIGETMVTLMLAGGAAVIPASLFDPVRPMPASIAAEMAEAPFRSQHYHALFAIGITLFLFTLAFNLLAARVAHKYKRTGSATL